MDDQAMDEGLLTQMADLLHSEGKNYSVFLRAYRGATRCASDVGDIVNRLIGYDAVITAVVDSNVIEVAEQVRECLCYVGDESAGPGSGTLGSAEFANLLERILEGVAQLGSRSHGVRSLEFLEGHPAYPVFWDFAFLFLGNDENVLLVGASSD